MKRQHLSKPPSRKPLSVGPGSQSGPSPAVDKKNGTHSARVPSAALSGHGGGPSHPPIKAGLSTSLPMGSPVATATRPGTGSRRKPSASVAGMYSLQQGGGSAVAAHHTSTRLASLAGTILAPGMQASVSTRSDGGSPDSSFGSNLVPQGYATLQPAGNPPPFVVPLSIVSKSAGFIPPSGPAGTLFPAISQPISSVQESTGARDRIPSASVARPVVDLNALNGVGGSKRAIMGTTSQPSSSKNLNSSMMKGFAGSELIGTASVSSIPPLASDPLAIASTVVGQSIFSKPIASYTPSKMPESPTGRGPVPGNLVHSGYSGPKVPAPPTMPNLSPVLGTRTLIASGLAPKIFSPTAHTYKTPPALLSYGDGISGTHSDSRADGLSAKAATAVGMASNSTGILVDRPRRLSMGDHSNSPLPFTQMPDLPLSTVELGQHSHASDGMWVNPLEASISQEDVRSAHSGDNRSQVDGSETGGDTTDEAQEIAPPSIPRGASRQSNEHAFDFRSVDGDSDTHEDGDNASHNGPPVAPSVGMQGSRMTALAAVSSLNTDVVQQGNRKFHRKPSLSHQNSIPSARSNRVRAALAPLVVKQKKLAEKERRRKKDKNLERKRKNAEKLAARELKEREAMLSEEWLQQRVRWWGDSSRQQGNWRTVRVFISSTFNDMHGERDVLTRVVFPILNNLCKSRRVRVVPVDLRWGLTSEDTSDSGLGALEHCLLEIDHSRPFFVYLCGERYGWIPPSYRVSDRPGFEWVNCFESGHAITAMEIYHGFLRRFFTPVHAFMYTRDPSFVETITNPDERRIFAFDYPNNPDILARRDLLRASVMSHPYVKSRNYTCSYGGLDDEGKPHVTNLQRFEEMVLEDLYAAITTEFPAPPQPMSNLDFERSSHMHFVEDRAGHFIGRQDLSDTLFTHADTGYTADSLPLVVVGAPGSGKTSLVAAFAKRYMESRTNVFTLVHVVSASPTSTDIREVLLRICRELKNRFPRLEWDEQDDSDDYQTVKDGFFKALDAAGEAALNEKTHIVLIVDAINQLNPFYNALTMDWFPTYLPAGIRAILSTTPDSQCLTALTKRDPRPPQLDIPGLSKSECEEIVVQQLREYRKRLTREQLELLLAKTESNKPLYLLTCCEELRLQAQYGVSGSGVDEKIRELPGEIPALMDVVLERVERDLAAWLKSTGAWVTLLLGDIPAEAASTPNGLATPFPASGEHGKAAFHGSALVRDALTLLVCSRHGLPESELLELMAPPGKAQLPAAIWTRLYRSLELYLRPMGEEEQGMLGFFHLQMAMAVRKRYLQDDRRAEALVCARLGDFFIRKADPSGTGRWEGEAKRYFADIVYYQLRALQLTGLKDTLGSLRFIERCADHGAGRMEHLLRDYHNAQEELRTLKYSILKDKLISAESSRAAQLQWLGEFMVFVGSHHSALAAYPNLTFQYALNQPDSSAPHKSADDVMMRQLKSLVVDLDKLADGKLYPNMTKLLLKDGSTPVPVNKKKSHLRGAMKTMKGKGISDPISDDEDQTKKDSRGEEHLKNFWTVDLVPRRYMDWVNKPQRNRIVADFAGFSSEVRKVVLSPDTTTMALGFADGSLQIVDSGTGEMVRELTIGGHLDAITCLSYSSDGLRLVSGGHDNRLVVWDALTGTWLSRMDVHYRSITSVVWLESDSAKKKIGGVAYRRTLASASLDNTLRIWEEKMKVRGGKGFTVGVSETRYEVIWTRDIMQSPILCLSYCGETNQLVAGHNDGEIQIWDAHAPNLGLIQLTHFPAHKFSQVIAVQISSDGSVIATGGADYAVKLFKREPLGAAWKEVLPSGSGHTGIVTSVNFSPDGMRLVTSSMDKRLLLWDIESASRILSMSGHADDVYSCAFMPDGTRVISASNDKTVKIWDVGGVDAQRVSAPVKRAQYQSLRDNARKNTLPLGVSGKIVLGRFNNMRAGAVNVKSPIGPASPLSPASSGHAESLALKSGAVHVPQAPAGSHGDTVQAIVVSSDGKRAVTGGKDREIKVWNVESGEEVCVLLGHKAEVTALHLSEVGRTMISGDSNGTILVWDGDSYDHRLTIQAHTSPVTAITSCFAAPAVAKPVKLPVGNSLAAIAALSTAKPAASKGTVIFTAAMDGSVKAWKASSGELWEIQPVSYHSHPIKALQFVPFGPTQRPTTSRPAPIHSGILPAVVTDKDGSVPVTQASDTGSFSNKSPREAPLGGIEPSVSVSGITPAHTHSRLLTVAGDGRLAVFDIYTGKVIHEDSTPASVGGVRAAHISRDGARIAISSNLPSLRNPLFVAPATALSRAVPAPLLLPSQAKRAQHIARDERVRAGIALAIRKRNSAANLQPLEINPTLSKKLADKKLRRKQRAAKRAERRLLNRTDEGSGDDSGSDSDSDNSIVSDASDDLKPRKDAAEDDDDGEAGTSGGKAALAVAFACDGTLIATGCSERLMTVTDAARPQLGPLAQFLAYGDVTAIAMGPGVLPWDDSGYAVDEDRTSAENKSTITFKRFRDEPLPRCGDGFGHIGVVVAGDSTGALFILRVADVMRKAEAQRLEALAVARANAAAALAREAEKQRELAAVEEVKAKQAAAEEAAKRSGGINAAIITFPNGNIAQTLAMPRALFSNRPKDTELVAKFFEAAGLDVASLDPHPCPYEDSVRLLEDTGLHLVVADGPGGAANRTPKRTRGQSSDRIVSNPDNGGEGSGDGDVTARDASDDGGLSPGHGPMSSPVGVDSLHDDTSRCAPEPPPQLVRLYKGELQTWTYSTNAQFLSTQIITSRGFEPHIAPALSVVNYLSNLISTKRAGGPVAPSTPAPQLSIGASPTPAELSGSPITPVRPHQQRGLKWKNVSKRALMVKAAFDPRATFSPVAGTSPPNGGNGASNSAPVTVIPTGTAPTMALASPPAVKTSPRLEDVGTNFNHASEHADDDNPDARSLRELRDSYWRSPKALICVFGGAAGLHDLLVPNLRSLIKKGAVGAACRLGGMVLDGGTASGVMAMVGAALRFTPPKTVRVVGVVPAALVSTPDQDPPPPDSTPLESHHSNFMMVPSKEWGGETSSMFALVAYLAARIPCLALVANGGMISRKEVLNAVRHSVPVIVIEGSGRLADQLARAFRAVHEGISPTTIADDDVREIMSKGELYLYNVASPALGLQQLIVTIADRQREQLYEKLNLSPE